MLKAASLGTDAAGIKLYHLTNAVNIGNLAEFFCQNSANSSELLLKLQYRVISWFKFNSLIASCSLELLAR